MNDIQDKLISKQGMSNIYLKVTTGKNRHSQNFNFLSLKNSSPGQFMWSSNSHRYHWGLQRLIPS